MKTYDQPEGLDPVSESCLSGEWDHLTTGDIIRLQEIQALIRQGSFNPAENLLTEMVESSVALDLLARLQVQKGDLKAARATWGKVLKLDAENLTAKAALRCLSSSLLFIAVTRRCLGITAVAILLFLSGIGLLYTIGFIPNAYQISGTNDLIVYRANPPLRITSEPTPEPPVQTEVIPQTVDVKASESQAISPSMLKIKPVPESPAVPTTIIPVIEMVDVIAVEGVSVTTSGNQLSLTFDEGVFHYRCELSDAGERVLKQVARVLSEKQQIEEVLVVGHTDNDPLPPGGIYRNNYELGFDRATTIATWLQSNSALHNGVLRATSEGSENPPFSNDTSDSRMRNRTVVLHVRFAKSLSDRGGQ